MPRALKYADMLISQPAMHNTNVPLLLSLPLQTLLLKPFPLSLLAL